MKDSDCQSQSYCRYAISAKKSTCLFPPTTFFLLAFVSATTQSIRRNVADVLRTLADQIDGPRLEHSSNNVRSTFHGNDAKVVLSRRVALLLLVIIISFAMAQQTIVHQLKILYYDGLTEGGRTVKRMHLEYETKNTSSSQPPPPMPMGISANNGTTDSDKGLSQLISDPVTSIFDDNNSTDDIIVCWPWSYSSDQWWTHHPTWKRSHANDTHYCYQKIQNERQAALYQAIYDVQFRHADCQNVFRRHMWSSGLGADFLNINRGLYQAAQFQRPFQISDAYPWHYAAGKGKYRENETMAACPSRDMYCFFLPLTKCPVGEASSENETLSNAFHLDETPLTIHNDTYHARDGKVSQCIFEYATRPQTWLWHKVYEYTQTRLNLTTPCMVMHVRRSDVLLHHKFARRYFSIAEYINASQRTNMITQDKVPNIFLITDDANAITEAVTEFPTFNWMYIRRKRYKADEGGWEQQTPSQDYVFEMTTLLSILEIVYGQSSFADFVVRSMESKHGRNLTVARVDEGIKVFDEANSKFRNISKEYSQLQEEKRQRKRRRRRQFELQENECTPLQRINDSHIMDMILFCHLFIPTQIGQIHYYRRYLQQEELTWTELSSTEKTTVTSSTSAKLEITQHRSDSDIPYS
ncbi:hypothetical protein IV203_034495 [Nitzschia inconspicua]|uniref:Uncharacterized protein n=1 Tax=Nitzschia inconspicua TaxID=303405 RepID=A0A9K3KAU7_9STRA|nr:hypothetical protein IV203_002551 [Nitzschia inconspicua]KAG7359397.1 hypothetical protein IV203_034495 [Nitzschia inconspicua]